jgi:hypothetical protein
MAQTCERATKALEDGQEDLQAGLQFFLGLETSVASAKTSLEEDRAKAVTILHARASKLHETINAQLSAGLAEVEALHATKAAEMATSANVCRAALGELSTVAEVVKRALESPANSILRVHASGTLEKSRALAVEERPRLADTNIQVGSSKDLPDFCLGLVKTCKSSQLPLPPMPPRTQELQEALGGSIFLLRKPLDLIYNFIRIGEDESSTEFDCRMATAFFLHGLGLVCFEKGGGERCSGRGAGCVDSVVAHVRRTACSRWA